MAAGCSRVEQALKHSVVRVIGRDRANVVSGPYHDWKARRVTRRYLRSLPARGLKINLGCGYHPLNGWVNLDNARVEGAQVIADVRRRLPFSTGSAEAIFAEHVVEHLSRPDGARLLRECRRVLAESGVLRISTPDLEQFLRSYAGDRTFLAQVPMPRSLVSASDRVNHAMRGHGHLWSYDEELLRSLLREAGFTSIVRQPCGMSSHRDMVGIDLEERAYESIYIEATS